MTPNFLIDLPPAPTELTVEYLWSLCHADFIARYKKKKEEIVLYPKLSISPDHDVLFSKAATFFSHHYIEINDKNIKILQELSKKDLEDKGLIKNNKILVNKEKIISFIEKINFKPEKFKDLFIQLAELSIFEDNFLSLSPQIMWMTETYLPTLYCPIFDLRLEQFDVVNTFNCFKTIVKSVYHNNQIPWKTILFVCPEYNFPTTKEFLTGFNLQYSVLTNKLSNSLEIVKKLKNNTNVITDYTEIDNLIKEYEYKKAFELLIESSLNEESVNYLEIFLPGIRFNLKT